MVVNDNNPKIWASLIAPNPDDVTYWVDLTADPHGNIIKFYDNNDEQWYNLTSPTSEYATYPYIGPNGNWFIENRDSGIRAQGDVPDATINGKRIADNPVLTKEDIGLGNVANLAPENYPVPDAVYGLIDGKVDESRTINGHALDTDVVITKGDIGLGNVENIAPADMPISTAAATALSGKTDATRNIVAGSGLTGGGNLTADRTINVVSATDGITVNADNIQLATVDSLTSTSTTRALSANQGKLLNDKNVAHDVALLERPIMIDPTGDVITPSMGSYSKDESDAKYVAKTQLVQTEGTSTTDVMSQKAVTDELTALETNLKQTDIKNAEQDASIKSIEQLLSQSNLNQTPQISSSGREIISLPKTASNGGVDIKLDGLTATQFVKNGNFAKDINSDGVADGWSVYGQTGFIMKTVSDNTQYLKSGSSAGYRLINPFTTSATDLFYLAFTYKTSSSAIGFYTNTRSSLPSSISFTKKSFRTNLISIGMRFTFDGFAENDELWIKNAIGINLTATFGAGNEPDLATCDAMFSTYFEGTKSFTPTGRVRSIGKNLFNGKLEYGTILSSDGTESPSSLVLRSKFIRVKPNSRYQFSDSLNLIDNLYYYDINKKLISLASRSVFNSNNTPTQCFYVRLSTNTNDINYNRNIQLEQNSVSTSFVSYRDSKLYITAPELKSNGIVKDEIRKGANGYEFVKRISEIDGTALNTPTITPIEHAGILNSAESGTVFHEPIVADAGVYGTNLTVFNTTYPISSIEEIIVHTNMDTYLDVNKAVIASDGLSFTHPDLRAGDLVLFTYFFSKEKVNGLITATYYDGRYVIADTANGKFYKWGVKSTNGVATIQLTEV